MWILVVLGMSLWATAVSRGQPTGWIAAWGQTQSGQCDVPEPNRGFQAIAAGYRHSLGLRSDGSVEAWGRNDDGECDVPAPNNGFVGVAAGYYHSLAVRTSGSVAAWGKNDYGQCDVPAPNTGFVAVAGARYHSLGLKANGRIVGWGYNYFGQCDVPGPNGGFVAIAADGWHSLGLRSDGSIEAWGRNDYGQCDVPDPNSGFVAIAAGAYYSLGLRADGTIEAWGRNNYGQCNVPPAQDGYVSLASGWEHNLAIRSSGYIEAWESDAFDRCTPPRIAGFMAVAAGYFHSLGLHREDPVPPSFAIQAPAVDLSLVQGDGITIAWLDDSQSEAQIYLFVDPDTGPSPWNQGGVNNEIVIPFSVEASDPQDNLEWHVADLSPGVYSVWGKSDNGVDPPAYSRAPGLVTVTEFSDDTPPTLDQDRIDLGSMPSPDYVRDDENALNLYLVTHGWNGTGGASADHSWIEHIASAVAGQIPPEARWDVVYYDWKSRAGDFAHGPNAAATDAMSLGLELATAINDGGYQHVEVVAHSAGSWMGHMIAHRLHRLNPDITVNLVLLDAYVPPRWIKDGLSLGDSANHVCNCYDAGIWDGSLFTQTNVSHAFNVDMTCRRVDGQLPLYAPYTGSPHGAPWAWYRESARWALGTFMDDESYSHSGQPAPLGFKMSKAYSGDNGGWDSAMSRYPANGNDEFDVCGNGLRSECGAGTTVFVEYSDTFDLSALVSSVGADGTVVIEAENVELTTGAQSVWVGFEVPLTRAVSAVTFDVEFISGDPDAEGYATGYWNGLHLAAADERFASEADPGSRSFVFYAPVDPGTKVVSFRLDNNGGPTSSVRISNLRCGINLGVDINGDCVASVEDLCAWAAEPFDLDGNGTADSDDMAVLASALGVSGSDTDGDGTPDSCETCFPDLNGDGVVNTQDFLAFLNLWVAGDPIADWNDDGTVNTQDFLAYLNDWAAGC